MLKKLAMIFSLCLLLVFPAAAEEMQETPGGKCGEKLQWELKGETLSVFGEGEMEDFSPVAPWFDYKEQITRVELAGVTKVGSFAFTGFEKLTSADLGEALTELGQSAFSGCTGLTELTFPASFRVFGEESLRGCTALTTIHCKGKFPSFKQNCLWQTNVKIEFPAERPWSVELIAQLEEAFHGRVEFLASDGSDPYVPTEATEPPTTQAPTTAVPETTAAPTTAATTEPVTTPTETQTPETAAPATAPVTVPATEPAEEPAKQQGSAVRIVLVVLVLAIAALGIAACPPTKKKKSRRRKPQSRR